MLQTVEQLKEERPDLVQIWENMSREELLDSIYKESFDAINMEERVQVFMSEVTDLSHTTYTPEVIKGLIDKFKSREISEFCKTALEDIEGMDVEEIKKYLKEEIEQ